MKLSLCIPSYNRPKLLFKTLKSVVCQTQKPWEVLVVDDCSTCDMSGIEAFCRQNGISFKTNRKNLGLMQNFNFLASQAKGDYVAFIHSDDLISFRFVELVEEFISKYPGFFVYTTNCVAIDERDFPIAEFRLFFKDATIFKKSGLRRLWKRNYFAFFSILGCTIFERKFLQSSLFDADCGNEADLDKALDILVNQDIQYIDRPIYFTRIHQNQESSRIKRTVENLEKNIHNRLRIYSRYNFEIAYYMETIKAIHAIQLFWKYHYSLKKIALLLDIQSLKQWLIIFLIIPRLVLGEIIKKIQFQFHRSRIKTYLLKIEQ